MKIIAQKILADGKTQALVKIGDGHLIYTVDPADPTKPHSSSFPLPTKDVKAFKAECGQT
ncbi:hypothetical protein [Pseudomonas putida]|uniref:hypothetical protein n=1 Tax=Pseudomonas putida TaxID=303 RepID=UPI00390688D2